MLRKMLESDLEMVLEWRNVEEVRRNMYNNHVISLEEHRAWFSRVSSMDSVINLIYEHDGEAVGVIAFTEIDQLAATASWAFYIGDITKRGLGIKMEKAALSYAFNELSLNKLWCEVLNFNERVAKFHQKFGFRVEGVFKSHYKRDGEYYDVIRLAILKSEWEKLK